MEVFKKGDKVKYLIAGDWVKATVTDTRTDDFDREIVTLCFWHDGREESIEVWASEASLVENRSIVRNTTLTIKGI